MTYKEAYNKIIDAYFKDEIKPLDNKFCFCGTLSPDMFWREGEFGDECPYPYSPKEYLLMEDSLFAGMNTILNTEVTPDTPLFEAMLLYDSKLPLYEDALFEGMSAALNTLREIHKSRGDNVDEEIPFVKRDLLNLKVVWNIND